jgi:hypothetical protein
VSGNSTPSNRVTTLLYVLAGTVATAGVILAAIIWLRWDAPPFRVKRDGDQIVVDVQTFGEYATTVTRFDLLT